MDWLWELIRGNPWLALILLGVVGQLFTPNPKKRKAARERKPASEPEPTRTDPDEVAERIRELFAGNAEPEPEPILEPEPIVQTYEPAVMDEVTSKHHAVAGTYFDPNSIGEEPKTPPPLPLTITVKKTGETAPGIVDPREAVRALLIFGPPRALASYDQDPLLSQHQRSR